MSTDIGDLAAKRSEEMDRRVVELRRALLADGVRSDDIPDPVAEALVLVIARLEARHAGELAVIRDRVERLEEALREEDDDDPPGEVHGRVGTMTIGDGQPIPIQGWTRDMQGIVMGFWEGHTAPEPPGATSPLPPDPPDRGPFGYR